MNFRTVPAVAALVFIAGCGSQSNVITTKEGQQQQKEVKTVYVEKEKNPVSQPQSEVMAQPEIPVSKPAPTNSAEVTAKYISLYKEAAKYEMKEYGIPASITLAQAILESAAGTSDLALRANNHFGIKCTEEWQGEKAYQNGECFRTYENPRRSFRDHSLFLQRKYYRDLFALDKNDYKGWAKGLRKSGYATDKNYHEKLINIIERYRLDAYDREVLAETPQEVPVVKAPSGNPTGAANDVEKYIALYKETAKYEMKEHGIPASITLAQAILESGAGTSEVAVRANNHFGIKCNNEWQGETFYRDSECFRKYENPRRSFSDHSLFLQRSHYSALFTLAKNDYKGWAKGLWEAGYAADRNYPEKLVNIIERYRLDAYDREVLAEAPQQPAVTETPSGNATSYANDVKKYIELYKEAAKYEMKEHGIPASITLAQAILESNAGMSEVAVRANNHFGIKCNNEWQGETFYRDSECFRKYEDARRSYQDHSVFLQRPHYRALSSLPKNDYKAWAKGIWEAGYAADSNYPEKLVNIIERYRLDVYDREVLAGTSGETPTVKTPSGPKQERYVVRQGDTLYSIARTYGMSVESLMQMNGLKNTRIAVGQVLTVTKPE
ncbi:MAG: glucosaminidase domain-containing protein [Sinomicrobium sp.]|nr:glucosaminidase domain-containing protein [Sinomicrobium sp.]